MTDTKSIYKLLKLFSWFINFFFPFFRELAQAGDKYACKDFDASQLLEEAANFYGRRFTRKMRMLSEDILESIEEQPDDVLMEALAKEKLHECDEREANKHHQWQREEAIQ